MSAIRCLPVLAALATTLPLAQAGPSDEISAAVANLRGGKSYSWTMTVETPGAPFTIPATKGSAGEAGFAIHESKIGDTTWRVVTKGDCAVFSSGTKWKQLAEMPRSKGKPSADLLELAEAKRPADELAALIANLNELKREADGACSGKLDAADAKTIMSLLVKRRAPIPNLEVSNASGTLRVEVTEGVVRKYILRTTGAISLGFGTKEITRIATVNISEVGAPPLVVPAEAKAKLEAVTQP